MTDEERWEEKEKLRKKGLLKPVPDFTYCTGAGCTKKDACKRYAFHYDMTNVKKIWWLSSRACIRDNHSAFKAFE